MMKHTNKLILLLAVLPWFSFPLLGKQTIKRFLPGALFITIVVILEGMYAEKKKWWWFSFNIKPNILGEFPLIFGPFFVGVFWILKLTYRKFNLYFLVNLLIDSFFTYYGVNVLKKFGYGSLVRLSKLQLSFCFFLKSLLLYGFQLLYEKYILERDTTS